MAHWEHGHRCHGLWVGNRRLGFVGLPPRGSPVVYSWSVDREYGPTGTRKTLRAAKRAVERATGLPVGHFAQTGQR